MLDNPHSSSLVPSIVANDTNSLYTRNNNHFVLKESWSSVNVSYKNASCFYDMDLNMSSYKNVQNACVNSQVKASSGPIKKPSLKGLESKASIFKMHLCMLEVDNIALSSKWNGNSNLEPECIKSERVELRGCLSSLDILKLVHLVIGNSSLFGSNYADTLGTTKSQMRKVLCQTICKIENKLSTQKGVLSNCLFWEWVI